MRHYRDPKTVDGFQIEHYRFDGDRLEYSCPVTRDWLPLHGGNLAKLQALIDEGRLVPDPVRVYRSAASWLTYRVSDANESVERLRPDGTWAKVAISPERIMLYFALGEFQRC